jgi:beta-lactamase class A
LHLTLLLSLAVGGVDAARPDVEKIIRESGAEVALVLRSLDGGDELLVQPDAVFHAASTMKVPVMVELFRQAEAGELSLDDRLPVENAFKSIVDGSPYSLSVEDDTDEEIYGAIGETRSLRELCEAMITVSSNLATNLLIEKLGVENIRRTVEALGATGMSVLRGVEDGKAFEKGLSNTTTAGALAVLFERIGRGEAVSPEASREMVAILKRQKWNDAIPAGLPERVAVAHKTGNITRIHHDGGIVYGPRPFVLVVLVRGLDDEAESARLIASITSRLYQELAP